MTTEHPYRCHAGCSDRRRVGLSGLRGGDLVWPVCAGQDTEDTSFPARRMVEEPLRTPEVSQKLAAQGLYPRASAARISPLCSPRL